MGTMNVVIDGYEDILHEISTMQAKSAKVINRTIADFKTRGQGWISQEVAKEYNIKKKDINEAKSGVKNRGQVRIAGVSLDNIEIVYQGRVLTPTHFSMKPTSRPSGGKYNVTAQIKKSGGRKSLGRNVFLAQSGHAGNTQIPFERVTAARYPINAVKTLSVPQMITNETVSDHIYSRINVELGKRLEHNLKRLMR